MNFMSKKSKLVEQIEPVEDRSAFNCKPCAGEGLIDENTVCPNCQGTGKVPVESQSTPGERVRIGTKITIAGI
jgi:DnaJ-class molecular chaperone